MFNLKKLSQVDTLEQPVNPAVQEPAPDDAPTEQYRSKAEQFFQKWDYADQDRLLENMWFYPYLKERIGEKSAQNMLMDNLASYFVGRIGSKLPTEVIDAALAEAGGAYLISHVNPLEIPKDSKYFDELLNQSLRVYHRSHEKEIIDLLPYLKYERQDNFILHMIQYNPNVVFNLIQQKNPYINDEIIIRSIKRDNSLIKKLPEEYLTDNVYKEIFFHYPHLWGTVDEDRRRKILNELEPNKELMMRDPYVFGESVKDFPIGVIWEDYFIKKLIDTDIPAAFEFLQNKEKLVQIINQEDNDEISKEYIHQIIHYLNPNHVPEQIKWHGEYMRRLLLKPEKWVQIDKDQFKKELEDNKDIYEKIAIKLDTVGQFKFAQYIPEGCEFETYFFEHLLKEYYHQKYSTWRDFTPRMRYFFGEKMNQDVAYNEEKIYNEYVNGQSILEGLPANYININLWVPYFAKNPENWPRNNSEVSHIVGEYLNTLPQKRVEYFMRILLDPDQDSSRIPDNVHWLDDFIGKRIEMNPDSLPYVLLIKGVHHIPNFKDNKVSPKQIEQRYPLKEGVVTIYDQAKAANYKISVYHGTSESKLKEIIQKGTMVSPRITQMEHYEHRTHALDQIFLTTSEKYSEDYANRAQGQTGTRPIVVEFSVPVTKFLEFKILSGEMDQDNVTKRIKDKNTRKRPVGKENKDQYSYYNESDVNIEPMNSFSEALYELYAIGNTELTLESSISAKYITDAVYTDNDESARELLRRALHDYLMQKLAFNLSRMKMGSKDIDPYGFI